MLELNAVFGGIEAKIPESWSVVVRGTGVFGAFQDSTGNRIRGSSRTRKADLKGGAVFGGSSEELRGHASDPGDQAAILFYLQAWIPISRCW